LVKVTVVAGVEESVSEGTVSSPAVSLGDGGGTEVGFRSVVEIARDVVVVVLVVVRVVVVVVSVAGAYVTGPSGRCELSEVSMTAYTSMANSAIAATPET
jgi:hypothetical protein